MYQAQKNKLLLTTLAQIQSALCNTVCASPQNSYRQLFHPDISPMGWHLGHTLCVENHWVQERLLQKAKAEHFEACFYMPEHSTRHLRSSWLPERVDLIELAQKIHTKSQQALRQNSEKNHPLLKDNYLILFLIQHHAMHLETLMMSKFAQQLKQTCQNYRPANLLKPEKFKCRPVAFEAGTCTVGCDQIECFDNEKPSHPQILAPFALNYSAASNAEFLTFMLDGGYENSNWWSRAGWQWLQTNKVCAPYHWRRNKTGQWFNAYPQGGTSLEATEPVHGINLFEASAFARWAGGRLPHEHELETAYKSAVLKSAPIWQWCGNVFYPYPGFKSFPYDGYSQPWFDNQHYVLKGGSLYTHKSLKRASYRNFYTAEKRHIFAGVRVAYGQNNPDAIKSASPHRKGFS